MPISYHRLKDSTRKGDQMTKSHKNCADTFIKISTGVAAMGTSEYTGLDKFLNKTADYFERARKLEGRVASDEDLKLVDLLRYYLRDTEAAKDLLYRRAKCLSEYENANKALDKARLKNKEVAAVSRLDYLHFPSEVRSGALIYSTKNGILNLSKYSL